MKGMFSAKNHVLLLSFLLFEVEGLEICYEQSLFKSTKYMQPGGEVPVPWYYLDCHVVSVPGCGFDVVASSSFRFQFSGFDSFESNEIVHQVSVFRHIIFCTRWKCIHAQILEFQNFFLHIVTTKSLVVKLFLHSIY